MAKKRDGFRRSKQIESRQDAVKRLDTLAKNLGEAKAEAESLAETVRDQLADETSILAIESPTTKKQKK